MNHPLGEEQGGDLNTETCLLLLSRYLHDWADIPTSRDLRQAGREAAGAPLTSMLLTSPSEPPQGTIPALLLEKHLRAWVCIFILCLSLKYPQLYKLWDVFCRQAL